MPVSLESAKENTTDDIDLAIIDEFRTSTLMDLLTFDDVMNPIGGGGTLTYVYRRETALATAAFRALNTEYADEELPPTERIAVDLAPLGGSFSIDRVIANVGVVASNELTRNMNAKIRATSATFSDSVINGDPAVGDENGFDGLSKILAGSSTENSEAIDWSGPMTQALGFKIIEDLDDLIGRIDGGVSGLIMNDKTINKVKAALRYTSQYVEKPGPRGEMRPFYGQTALIDPGRKAGANEQILPLAEGVGAIYAVRFDVNDGFHGVSMANQPLVRYILPDFTRAGAVQRGEVEMGPVAVALKATKAAAVNRNVKVI